MLLTNCGIVPYLEDPSGAVRLDLSLAKFDTGLYAENCLALATVCFCVDNLWNVVPGVPEWCCEATV